MVIDCTFEAYEGYDFVIALKRSGRSGSWYNRRRFRGSPAMTKLLVVTTFAAIAFAAGPASACDWNREASTNDPAVATAATPAEPTTSPAAATPPQAARVVSDDNARKSVDEPAPVVLITDRH
jgi:hypothetical protein